VTGNEHSTDDDGGRAGDAHVTPQASRAMTQPVEKIFNCGVERDWKEAGISR
jgi:hypothetical protein